MRVSFSTARIGTYGQVFHIVEVSFGFIFIRLGFWLRSPFYIGYLLYGEPGTGKSSTIHALASELGLEIYYIQLASQGCVITLSAAYFLLIVLFRMDDHHLASLIGSTPSRCILLLEDIDCAFPSREDDDDDDDLKDANGNPISLGYQPRSEVTLSGLLNVLDSVTSEEGRITFATASLSLHDMSIGRELETDLNINQTNHIEKLDPALIRAGRMDVKLEYKLASKHQIHQTFLRFFERRFTGPISQIVEQTDSKNSSPALPTLSGIKGPRPEEAPLTNEEVHMLSQQFSDSIPEYMFSLAQVQGYLLTKKMEPRGAVEQAAKWVEDQITEKRKIQELKESKKAKWRERKLAEKKKAEEEEAGSEQEPSDVEAVAA